MEMLVLGLFAGGLFLCVVLQASILYGLAAGFLLFFGSGLYKKHTAREMLRMAVSGVKTVKNVLITFILIGMLTALWRAGGTIPFLVYHALRVCSPRAMVLLTFLLCSAIAFMTGTAFGTAATMGVICVSVAGSMGIPILYSGGAVLAGSFFGDRCSPMSTSALLVATLTKTDLYRNIGTMFRTAAAPFVLTCAVYALLGLRAGASCDVSGMQALFSQSFRLHVAVAIPAAAILLLAVFRVNVKISMLVSVVCSVVVCAAVQGLSPTQIARVALLGFAPDDAQLAQLLAGGGIVSMAKVFCVVCISSCYSGMFRATGLLDGLHGGLRKLSRVITPFGCIFVTASLASIIACNQVLAIMLTQQLCSDIEPDGARMASALEDTAAVIAPLVPWSIAAAVPLASVGAPSACILTACYLYLLPLWRLAVELVRQKRRGAPSARQERL